MRTISLFFATTAIVLVSFGMLSAQTSMLDKTFGTNGTVRNYILGGDSSADVATAVAIQSDGKIVVAGNSVAKDVLNNNFFVVRYDTDGTPDNTFGIDGMVLAGGDDWTAKAIAIQSDGKIVVAGSADISPNAYASNNIYEFALYRLNSNGTLDNSFGISGESNTAILGGDSTTDWGYAEAIQSDGKIVVAGSSIDSNRVAFALARFNSNGTVDRTFGANGTVRNYIAGRDTFDDEAHAVAIQSDGKIVAAGWSIDPYSATVQAIALARYNSNGTLDNTFGNAGTVRVAIPIPGTPDENGLAYSVAVLPDGKILVGGYSIDSGFAVIRFDSNGSIDNTFGITGAATTFISGSDGTNDEALSMAVGSDGKIALAGHSSLPGPASNVAFAVACFDSDGSLDKTFGTNGSTLAAISGGDTTDDEANAVAIQSNGKIIAVGYSAGTPPYLGSIGWAFAVARFLPSGVTGIRQLSSVPGSFGLFQNYPNPFNPTTVISYKLSAVSSVSLRVYDILGREVATLVNGRENAGSYSVTFDGSRLASGVYFYRLEAGNHTSTKKLVLMK